ncbi:uncharacterized protein LOC106060946 isoform X2 [Biomphalaria glabrata]|nr:uncharacterized protein LOC106060946 isoform X2 [Biomphalaria glabrata]
MELNQLLANGTSECLGKCIIIANGSEESSPQNLRKQTEREEVVLLSASCSSSHIKDDKDLQKIKEDISEIEKSHLKKYKLINQKLASLEKQTTETILKDIDTRNNLKFEEIMKELHSASDFMSHLQSQNEILANSVKEKTEQINDMQQTLNEIKAQSVTNSSNLNSADTQPYEFSEKLSDNSNMIQSLQSQSDSISTKMNAMESNCYNITTEVDSLKRSVSELVDAASKIRLSMEQTFNDQDTKIDALQTKFYDYKSEPEETLSKDDDSSLDDEAVGFDARVPLDSSRFDLVEDEILTCFTSVTEDVLENFDTETGIFNIPCDGLYLCGLFIDIITFVQHDLEFGIYVRESDGSEIVVGHCHCKQRDITVSEIVIRQLKENDKVFVKSCKNHKKIQFSNFSHFLCALIKDQ